MTTYIITVNGKTYEVDVEKKGSSSTTKTSVSISAPVAQVAPKPAPQQTSVTHQPAKGGAGTLTAPMPGKIISVKVVVGDHVQKGQELIIMEAMKMHNPVLATNEGLIKEIYVKQGDPVQTGAALISIG